MNEEKRLCRTPTPGKQPTVIPEWKYEEVRRVIRRVVPRDPPGIPAKDLPEIVRSELSAEVKAELGSITWHTTTVKLEMEVAGELARVPGRKPQHLVRP
ncbi:MAG: hypothetical protein DHS20C21_12450 [Gemmatimonadota bacterium]|nr:MAG: hypothetical protein DHS20C21_12450 [Gemmatimonadota bacterium]